MAMTLTRRQASKRYGIPLDNYDFCAGRGEVMTPDAALRPIACGKPRKGHGRWHSNRQVRWRGRWVRPVYRDEYIDQEVAKWRTTT